MQYKVSKVKSGELEKVVRIVSDALLIPRKDQKRAVDYMKAHGIGNVLAIRHGAKIIGGLQMHHWGHFFGGRSVPAAGITFVGILPEYRRVGAASELMADTVRRLHDEGVPISTLYPANVPLYRKSGYEIAMERHIFTLKLANIPTRNMSLDVVPHKGKSIKALEEIYRRFAATTNGNIDRGRNEWKLLMGAWWRGKAIAYLVKRGGKTEGYILLIEEIEKRTLKFHDYVALTRDAAERLLTFIADYSTMVEKASFPGSHTDPLLLLLPQKAYEMRESLNCMLRIVSVPGALRARGYPRGVEGEVHFEVADDIIKENNGGFVLKVKNGKGTVKRGGNKRIRIDIRTLAQLYAGFLSPMELKVSGHIDGSNSDLIDATPIFAGPRPWLRDIF